VGSSPEAGIKIYPAYVRFEKGNEETDWTVPSEKVKTITCD